MSHYVVPIQPAPVIDFSPKQYQPCEKKKYLNVQTNLRFFSFLGQVSFGSLAREGSGSPLLVTENVTSATTHVTKVTALQQKKT